MKLTAKQFLDIAFGDGPDSSEDGYVVFTCNSCDCEITSDDLVTPVHPDTGFPEGSGHGGIDGMAIFCAHNEPVIDEDGNLNAYCGWGGSLREYIPLLLCAKCLKSPFVPEDDNE